MDQHSYDSSHAPATEALIITTPLDNYTFGNTLLKVAVDSSSFAEFSFDIFRDKSKSKPDHTKTIQLLVSAGADVNIRGEHDSTALHSAALYGQNQIVRLLIQAGADVHTVTRNGSTPLHQAASNGNGETVRTLITAGADIQVRDNFGRTPLHSAAENDDPGPIHVLITSGCDVNSVTRDGQSPLDIAKWYSGIWRSTDTVRAIIAAGGQSRSPIDR